MKRRVLIIGKSGRLSQSLQPILAQSEELEITALSSIEIDITDPESIELAIATFSPDIVINTAAYTNVGKVETEREQAYALNVEGAKNVAAECAKFPNMKLIHISTDQVFSGDRFAGNQIPYNESDIPGDNQTNYYGRTKKLGEDAVLECNPASIIVRIQWPYGSSGKDFVGAIARALTKGEPLSVVTDEIGKPSDWNFISTQILYIIHQNIPAGIYHAVPEGEMSRFDQAKIIRELLRLPTEIMPVTQEEFGRGKILTLNPRYSALQDTKLLNGSNAEGDLRRFLGK